MSTKNTNKIILAVTGLPGSGKSVATEYLIKKTGWPKVYFPEPIFDEIKEKGLEVNQENEKKIREEFRKKLGMGAFATINLPKVKELLKKSSVLLESFYSWEEYLIFKKEFGEKFFVLAVYSSPDTREKRLLNRPFRPLKKGEIVLRDYSQIENLHQAGPIARADFTVINEGDENYLYNQLDKIIDALLNK